MIKDYLNKRVPTPIAVFIIILITFLVAGVIALQGKYLLELEKEIKETEIKTPGTEEVAIEKEITKEEILNWKDYRCEDYGFSIKIHPDYINEEKKDVDRKGIKISSITFSTTKEEVSIIIDKGSEGIEIDRRALLDGFKQASTMSEEAFESTKYLLEIVDPGIEIISFDKFEKGTCLGTQTLGRRAGKYELDLALTSLNLEAMYITVSFKYYTKDIDKVFKMIETIECTK